MFGPEGIQRLDDGSYPSRQVIDLTRPDEVASCKVDSPTDNLSRKGNPGTVCRGAKRRLLESDSSTGTVSGSLMAVETDLGGVEQRKSRRAKKQRINYAGADLFSFSIEGMTEMIKQAEADITAIDQWRDEQIIAIKQRCEEDKSLVLKRRDKLTEYRDNLSNFGRDSKVDCYKPGRR